MRYLVVGADRVDAGKTTFSLGLLHRIGGTGFKPRAGNDVWFDHDDYLEAVEAGRLYGKDARRLAAAGPETATPESINPIHRLWGPVPGSGPILGQTGRALLLDRVGDEYVVSDAVELPESARRSLPLEQADRVGTLEELNEVMAERHLPRLTALAERVAGTDPVVVESYGDVARPLRGFTPDRVAVVGPGRLRVYDGERFDAACEVATGGPDAGALEERVPDVVQPLTPEATVALPPLPAATRRSPERIATAYEAAIDALIG